MKDVSTVKTNLQPLFLPIVSFLLAPPKKRDVLNFNSKETPHTV